VRAAPPGQTGTPIRYGETVSGEITEATACQIYWFNGSEGDPITIDMVRTSGTLDGVLALYRRDGSNFTAQPVASNDDGPGGLLDPQIITRLPVTDWYSITACRLQHEQMRVTTGTFDLTLTGTGVLPSVPVIEATATPVTSLTEGIFAVPSGDGATPAVPAPAVTPTGMFSDWASSDQATATETAALSSGSTLTGRLESDQAAVQYTLTVQAGDQVELIWQRTAGDLAPLLRVSAEDVIAQTSTPDTVSQLVLSFRAPDAAALSVTVGRFGDAAEGTSGGFTLAVTITGNAPPAPTPTPDESSSAAVPAYLANPCQSGASAITGLASSERLIDVYTAAGDSYYPDELTRTTTFRQDDDLNAVFRVQNVSGSATVGGVFCAPSGDAHDGGSGDFENGGPFLAGLDWEAESTNWEPGHWYVELYVDGTLELTLGFDVE
jgi:hypothetical protein